MEKPNTRTETLTQKGDYKFDRLTVVEIGKKTLKDTKIKVGECILEVNGTFAMDKAYVTKLLKEASYPTKVKVAQDKWVKTSLIFKKNWLRLHAISRVCLVRYAMSAVLSLVLTQCVSFDCVLGLL